MDGDRWVYMWPWRPSLSYMSSHPGILSTFGSKTVLVSASSAYTAIIPPHLPSTKLKLSIPTSGKLATFGNTRDAPVRLENSTAKLSLLWSVSICIFLQSDCWHEPFSLNSMPCRVVLTDSYLTVEIEKTPVVYHEPARRVVSVRHPWISPARIPSLCSDKASLCYAPSVTVL